MSDSEEEEIKVIRFKHEGVDYLKDANDFLYDPKSSEVVGYWNAGTKAVEEVTEFDSDDESDDESDDDSSDDESDPLSHLTPRAKAELLAAQREERGEEEEETQRPIYGIIQTNPQYTHEEIMAMFAESDNVSYYDK